MLPSHNSQAIGNNCNQMQSLNLGWCENVSDEGVTRLAYGCPDLRALDLCGCVLITGILIPKFVIAINGHLRKYCALLLCLNGNT